MPKPKAEDRALDGRKFTHNQEVGSLRYVEGSARRTLNELDIAVGIGRTNCVRTTNGTFDRMHLFILATRVTYSKCAHRLPCSGGPKPTRHFERLTRGEAAVNELTANPRFAWFWHPTADWWAALLSPRREPDRDRPGKRQRRTTGCVRRNERCGCARRRSGQPCSAGSRRSGRPRSPTSC